RFRREPGGTPVAACVRALLLHPDATLAALSEADLVETSEPAEKLLPLTEVLLLSAARAQHVVRIREWLMLGEIVICDRFIDATFAYQGTARGVSQEIIKQAEELATGGLRPDLTLLFDLSVEDGQRRKKRGVRKSFPQQLGLFNVPRTQGSPLDVGKSGLSATHEVEMNRLDRETVAFYESVRRGYLARWEAEPDRIVK